MEFTNNESEKIYFCDNGYGEMAIMIRGPRGGEKGDYLLSPASVRQLIEFLEDWLSWIK